MKRRNQVAKPVRALLVLAIAGLFVHSPAEVLSAPAPLKAELVYSNGGRLIQIAADGSARSVLTYKGEPPVAGLLGALGDHSPRVSPDGNRLLFTRVLDDGGMAPATFFMVADRDGSHPRRILGSRKGVEFGDPAWMPDGSVIATREVRKPRKIERSVVKTGVFGGAVTELLRLRPHLQGSQRRDLGSNFDPIDLAPSPDGRSLLIGMSDGYKDDHRWLELADLTTGVRRNIAPGGYSGAWSPDGSKIVYSSNRGRKGAVCDDENICTRSGDLFVADADGSRPVRLTRTRGDEDHPTWSADGGRIAYSSNRNVPWLKEAAEIYSIAPDGTCQTWLTNGSPASVEPDWRPAPGDSTPAGCGATPREVLAETKPVPVTTIPKDPRLWLGSTFGGRLLTSDFEFFGFEMLDYRDCAHYDGGSCVPPPSVFSLSSCLAAGSTAEILSGLGRQSVVGTRRGVLTLTPRRSGRPGRARFMIALSGGGLNFLFEYAGKRAKSAAGKAPRAFRGLRPMGSEVRPKRLPAFRVAVRDLRRMRQVKAAVRRTGSVRTAAKRLDLQRKQIRENLYMGRILGRYGSYRPMRCPNLDALFRLSRDRARYAPGAEHLPRWAARTYDGLGLRWPGR